MKKSAIIHPRGSAQYVVEHAAWQHARGRNPSERFQDFDNPREALRVATNLVFGCCGCGGDILPGQGCEPYLWDPSYDWHLSDESMRWHYGLGFGSQEFTSPIESIMSMHLQQWGMSREQAHAIITQLSFRAA